MVLVSMDVDALADAARRIREVYDLSMDQWTQVGNAAGRALGDVSRMSQGLSTHLPPLMHIAKDLEARIDLAILVNTGDDGRVPGGVLTYTVPGGVESIDAVKQALGEHLAELAGSDRVTSSAEGMRELDERLERYLRDETVMGSFYSALGAGGLMELMGRTEDHVYAANIGIEVRSSLLEHLRTGLHTADAGWPPSRSAQFAADLVRMATGQDDNAGTYSHRNTFHGGLSYLLFDSGYSDAFLRSAGHEIDAHERSSALSPHGPWPVLMGVNTWTAYFPEGSVSASWDPAVSLMSALGNNASVSLEFFSEGSPDGALTDKQRYWIHDRSWDEDQFAQLSSALLAATTDPRLIQPWDSASAAQAAALASHTVNLIGHRGIDHHVLTGPVALTGPHGQTIAAENFAQILSTYMHGVDNAIVALGTGVGWEEGGTTKFSLQYYPGTAENTPIFNPDSLDTFIAIAAGTDEGLAELRAGMDTYASRVYGLSLERLAEDPSDDVRQSNFQRGYQNQARMEGLFVNAIGESAIARARGADETRAAWVSLASDVVGLVPVGKVVTAAGGDQLATTVVSFVAGKSRSAGASAVTSAFALEAETVTEQNDLALAAYGRANHNVLEHVAQYPELMGDALPAGVAWAPGGTLLPWDEFVQLPGGVRQSGISYLQTPHNGAGRYFNSADFNVQYGSAFSEYFEKGDG